VGDFMLKLKDLKRVKRVIVHGKCHDGMASAIFLYDAFGIEPEFLCHGTPEYQNLEVTPGMLFCDISPPADRYQEFVDAGGIVLDHHKKAEHIVKAFGEKGVFADEVEDPGISGGTLAFYHVWLPLANEGLVFNSQRVSKSRIIKFKFLADLVGVADTWQKNDPRWERARYLISALVFYSWDYWKNALNIHFDLSREMEVGRLIYVDRLAMAEAKAKEVHRFEYGGLKVGVFNDLGNFTSDVADVLRGQGVSLVAGFSYYTSQNKNYLRLSLRSDGTVDASALAQFADPQGGGHTKAAGCSLPVAKVDNDPFISFKEIVKDFLLIQELE
jgi:hypothetical protein